MCEVIFIDKKLIEKNELSAENTADNLKADKKLIDEKLSYLRAEEPKISQELVLGVSASEELIEFFKHPQYHEELKYLFDTTFQIEYKSADTLFLGFNVFTDKRVLMTGKSQYLQSRQDIKEFIESLGAEVASGVTKKLDYLVIGENPGSEKVKKAIDLNIPILNEKEFFDKLEPNILDKFFILSNKL